MGWGWLLCLTLGPGIPQSRMVPGSGRQLALETQQDGGTRMGAVKDSYARMRAI